ncbi:hypothetical protein P7C70_g7771, partial [Phenoliferia sp. Uapishka_3]
MPATTPPRPSRPSEPLSWISFSPDAPLTPAPKGARPQLNGFASARSSKPPAYVPTTPTRASHLGTPFRPPRPDAFITESDAEEFKDDVAFFASPNIAVANSGKIVGRYNGVSMQDFGFPSAAVPSSPTSSRSGSRASTLSFPNSPSLSAPSEPSSAFSTTSDDKGQLESAQARGATTSPTNDEVDLLPAWSQSPSGRGHFIFNPRQAGVEDGGVWEDELYDALPNPMTPKTPQHPYYSRHGPRSPTRSRRSSGAVVVRRTSIAVVVSPRRLSLPASAHVSPTTPRYHLFYTTFAKTSKRPEVNTSSRQRSYVAPRSPGLGGVPKKVSGGNKSRARKPARTAAEQREKLLATDAHVVVGLDAFFGVAPQQGKALRSGYAGLGRATSGGSKDADAGEYRPLLTRKDSDHLRSGSPISEGSLEDDFDDTDFEPTPKKRPPPLDLSRTKFQAPYGASNHHDEDHPINSARTIATPSPYVFTPDPVTREIRRRMSEELLRPAKVVEAPKISRHLKNKKSLGGALKAAWANLIDPDGEERRQGPPTRSVFD